jgi:hypothetical protein
MFIPKWAIGCIGIWLILINYTEAKEGLSAIMQDIGLNPGVIVTLEH